MSLQDSRPACSDVAGLLQPYADGELLDDERERVATHLEGCASCRSGVSDQLWVRAMLRAGDRPVAPRALRARIALALDQVDREAPAPAPAPSRAGGLSTALEGLWRRLASGGLVAIPTAAVALALAWVVQNDDTTEPVSGVEALSSSMIVGRRDLELTAQPRVQADLPAVEEPVWREATTPIYQDDPEPELRPGSSRQVQLVGAGVDPAGLARGRGGAHLTFRVFDHRDDHGHHVVDRQRPAGDPPPVGVPVLFRGQRFLMGQAPDGQPFLHFEREGVAHFVHIEGRPPTRRPSPHDDLALLLDVAAAVAGDP